MPNEAHAPSPEVVEFKHAWHDLAIAQAELDEAARQARDAVALDPMRLEDDEAVRAETEATDERINVRVSVANADPETVRAVATTNLLLIRATTRDGRVVERLVRLPSSVVLDDWEAEFEDGTFTISLARQTSGPVVLWRPAD